MTRPDLTTTESSSPSERTSPRLLQVRRPHYEQEQLNNELLYSKPKSDGCQAFIPEPSNCSLWNFIKSIFPILDWLPKYSWKTDFASDIISGCTVAVMHIPQGMGYALLGNVPPIVGIYMAFYPVLVYFLLGTSKHISMGTFAVISIMVGKVVQAYAILDTDQSAMRINSTLTEVMDTDKYSTIEVATAVCFLVGVMQLIMFVLRLGLITSLLSDALVSGFTTGAAIHVFTSQMKDIFGVTIKLKPGYFEVINTYLEIYKNFGTMNYLAVVFSTSTIIIILINNEVFKEKLAKKCILPVPIELVLVLSGTCISKYMFLERDYGIKTLHNIPIGFPDMVFPRTDIMAKVLIDSISIAIVSYAITISIAITYAQKFNYEVNSNQELLAMGTGNVIGSFFSCMPFSASLSRSVIQQTVGGKTQIASIISCSILACVLAWIASFFEPLPKSVLAGIIVVALKSLLMQVTHFLKFLKLSKLDALVWISTFLAVVIISIDIGLLVGAIFSLACIFIRGMKPYTCLLGHVANTDLYLDIKRYKAAEELPHIKIFHFCGSINFASRDTFKTELCALLGIDLPREVKRYNKALNQNSKYDSSRMGFKCLILDFSALCYIDPSGVGLLKSLINDFQKLSAFVYVAGCSCPVYEVMKKCDLRENGDDQFKLFPTVHDAVLYATDVITPISIVNVKTISYL